MKTVEAFTHFASFPYFTYREMKNLCADKSESTIKSVLKRNRGEKIYRLKQGMYVTKEFLTYHTDPWYRYFLSHHLVSPSYISLTSALDRHGLFSESSFGITCVTSTKTAEYQNEVGTFLYRYIKPTLFTGTETVRIWVYDISMATKAKAVFDYFWYHKKKFQSFSEDELESYRINRDLLDRNDLEELNIYVCHSRSKKMERLYLLICQICDKQN